MSSKPLIQDSEPLESRLKEIPLEPGIYLMRDHSASIIYIGKSRKLRTRVRSYFRDSQPLSPRIAMMVAQVTDIEFIVTDTEAEALALEANLIKQHQPYYNVLLKDDKKYPYVVITWSEDYPRIFITRKRRMGNKQDKYYGPYVDVKLLRNTLALVKQLFPIRQRPKPLFKDRPCLNYDLGRCPGVCQKLITPEEYRQTIQKIAMVFQGRTGELIEMLTANMEQAAESLNFELAARIRDQITGLKSLSTDQKVALPDDTVSRDAIALAADPKHACIQLFQIRAGHLVGRLGFFADVAPQGNGPIELGAILQRVLEEHYQTADAVEIPTEILVQHPLPDGEMLADYLSVRKGRNVTILTPQRQTKAELIEMVKRNANYELERTQRLVDRNTKAMEDLANILDLPDLPRRIEGYDISHIQGSNAVASQVVFLDGTPAKQHYRHYKIKNPNITVGHSDDFASLAEVIRRRFKKSQLEPELADSISSTINNQHSTINNQQSTLRKDWPDLVMIDGGKGQLSAVVAVLQELNLQEEVPVVSLAKQYEELFLPGEPLPLATDPEQPGVQLLRRVRDEAHRFAVNFHRKQRSSQLHRSRLDEIPGLGFQRQKQLLAHFNSIDYIRNASVKQLAEVPGIGLRLSQEIYHYFHP
ncbi:MULTISPECIES: excinuclease ABC subunit UvrC [unclassified Moorena]|uniref:excinuclease ABC subunit UvrC n=1 Tax=unclassified Moorena TaxID=2683338 RepID=UPI0013C0D094|nr:MULTISPECIES: excinuclease ABC subunit UvrC [unclassified Moorena]NEO05308.1 excinuclease ABC subunit UvrC [Moorena sp. SIO3I8]NEO21205.1 excinuclease ABC subunit UvrC [Moorena sp. SIO4A5]NEP24961.1 excinuclease ABC subunit UvrC [Moorena sp. SIO3I6]NEQ59931.1 excinuclease ABC subunit UvrC [Moorena sp. SIO4A1]